MVVFFVTTMPLSDAGDLVSSDGWSWLFDVVSRIHPFPHVVLA